MAAVFLLLIIVVFLLARSMAQPYSQATLTGRSKELKSEFDSLCRIAELNMRMCRSEKDLWILFKIEIKKLRSWRTKIDYKYYNARLSDLWVYYYNKKASFKQWKKIHGF
jgi:hypothetical protein